MTLTQYLIEKGDITELSPSRHVKVKGIGCGSH